MQNNEDAPLPRGPRVGVALGPGGAVVRAPRGPAAARPLPPAASAEWEPALQALFADLRAGGVRTADVALLRPLCAAKALRLPPLRGEALRALAQRGAERWFPLAGDAAVAVLPLRAPAEGGATAIVAAAERQVVEAVLDAATRAGVEVTSVSPAPFAAAAGALALARDLRRGSHLLVLPYAHATEAVRLRGGRPCAVRTLPLPPGDGGAARRAEQVRELVRWAEEEGGDAPAVALGAGADPELARALGMTPEALDGARIDGAQGAEALAAFGATLAGARRHDLRPDARRLPGRRAALRRTGALLAGAAAVAAVAAAAHLRTLEEAADHAARARATLRPGVEQVLRTRGEIDALRDRLAALERADAARPRWVPFFARVAQVLPPDAYLQSLRSDGAEVSVEGYAASVASLVVALDRSPGVQGVRITAPVQREQTAAGERERFSLRFAAPDLLPASVEGDADRDSDAEGDGAALSGGAP